MCAPTCRLPQLRILVRVGRPDMPIVEVSKCGFMLCCTTGSFLALCKISMGLSVNGTRAHLHLQAETEPMVSVTNFKVSQITEVNEAAGGKHAE